VIKSLTTFFFPEAPSRSQPFFDPIIPQYTFPSPPFFRNDPFFPSAPVWWLLVGFNPFYCSVVLRPRRLVFPCPFSPLSFFCWESPFLSRFFSLFGPPTNYPPPMSLCGKPGPPFPVCESFLPPFFFITFVMQCFQTVVFLFHSLFSRSLDAWFIFLPRGLPRSHCFLVNLVGNCVSVASFSLRFFLPPSVLFLFFLLEVSYSTSGTTLSKFTDREQFSGTETKVMLVTGFSSFPYPGDFPCSLSPGGTRKR